MNLPNKLSVFRIVVIPLFLLTLLAPIYVPAERPALIGAVMLVALILSIVVAITDWLDGKIARERQLISNLGKLLDPLADKIFVTSALVGLVELRLIPAWAVVIIVAREFLVTGLRTLAVEQGRVIAADRLGKHKTGWQLGLIIGTITLVTLEYFLIAAGDRLPFPLRHYVLAREIAVWITLFIALGLTVASGWNYARANGDVLGESN